MLPVSDPHPVIENPLTIRASAALPAAGAYDAAPTEFSVAGFDQLTIYGTYTRGGAGGAADLQAQASPYAQDAIGPSWFDQSLMSAGVLAAGADTQSRVQREFVTYQATAAGAQSFVVGVLRIAGVERIRIRARESGAVGTPGTLALVGVLHMDG